MAQAVLERVSLNGVDMVIGTGTTVAGTLDVVTGLAKVVHFQAIWTAAPGADSRWYWSASGGTVTITSQSEAIAFSWAAYGRN